MAVRKSKPTADNKSIQDLREHFAALCQGQVALTRHASPTTREVIAQNEDAWHVYMAFALAVSRGSKTDRALLRQLRSRFSRAGNDLELRRARFATVVEDAISLLHSRSANANEIETAVLRVASAINAELDLWQRFEERPWNDAETGGYSNWPLKLVGEILDASKLPDASRPRDKRGGRATFGVAATAAKLSRQFALFGDDEAATNADVAKKFAKARLRRT